MADSSKLIDNRGVRVIEPCTFFTLDRPIKIIVLKLDQLGDLIVAIPALVRLSEKFKRAAIDIVVGQWNAALADELKIFRNIHVYQLPTKEWAGTPNEEKSLKDNLLKHLDAYDIAIDLRRHRNTRFILSKISAELKVGYRSFTEFDKDLDICLDTELDEMDLVKRPTRGSMAVQLLNLIEAIPGKSILLPSLGPLTESRKEIAVFPKAGSAVKEWPLQCYLSLAEKISEKKVADAINFYLGPSEDDIATLLSDVPNSNIYIGLGIRELVISLSKNFLTVTNDSFGSHLSSYLGIPSVVVFSGRDNVWEWHPPFGNSTIVYSDVSCSPCHLGEISQCSHNLICLNQISVDLVFEAVMKNVGKGRQKKGLAFIS
jgi:ADP-heptose:LPS heptosyltransferase